MVVPGGVASRKRPHGRTAPGASRRSRHAHNRRRAHDEPMSEQASPPGQQPPPGGLQPAFQQKECPHPRRHRGCHVPPGHRLRRSKRPDRGRTRGNAHRDGYGNGRRARNGNDDSHDNGDRNRNGRDHQDRDTHRTGAEIPGNGIFIVGEDIEPGTFRTPGPLDVEFSNCYWARLSGTPGEFGDIIANCNAEGPVSVTVAATDVAFETQGCKEWQKTD
jgi:hypothetical protein